MRILMVTPLLPHDQAISAGALVMYGQLVALARHHTVTLVTFAGPDPADAEGLVRLRALGIEVHAIWRQEPTGIRRWRRRWSLAWRWLRGTRPLRTLEFAEPEMQRLLDRLLCEERFDLLQIEDNAMGNYRYATPIPSVLIEYEVRCDSSGTQHDERRRTVRESLKAADWQRWHKYQRDVWCRFDRIQVFTAHDATAMRSILPECATRIHINPFGIDMPAEANRVYEEERTLVFVGGFAHPPNVDAALWLGNAIMPLVDAQCPNVRLIIVGSGPPDDVRALASANVIVTGWVPTVEPYLAQASVVVAPLRLGGGMRLKVLHAMALGKAVVTTPIGAEGLERVDGLPPLVIASNAECFAAAVVRLLAQQGERHALGQRARAFVAQHHGWEAYRDRLELMYNELFEDSMVQL